MMIDPKVLLPCPFCGGGVEIDKVDEEHCRNVKIYSAVHCAECGQWFFKGMSEEKAIAAWNRRTTLPAHVEEKESEIKRLQAVVEAAKERQKLIINWRQLLCDAPNNHKLIPGLAEAIEEIHQADIRLEQALALAAGYTEQSEGGEG